MNVILIGATQSFLPPFESLTAADEIAEFAGRSCYQSFHKPNPATSDNKGYLSNVIKQAHFSVLEHNSFTFYVEGVSRALTHELIRHRHLSFSQLSQRFVNESDREFPVFPPLFGNSKSIGRLIALGTEVNVVTSRAYSEAVQLLEAEFPRKQAREAARAFLPNMTETKIVVSGNLRAWREFIAKRDNPHADAEIRMLASTIKDILVAQAPNSMQHIEEENR